MRKLVRRARLAAYRFRSGRLVGVFRHSLHPFYFAARRRDVPFRSIFWLFGACTVEAHSAGLGKGSAFVIRLPVTQAHAGADSVAPVENNGAPTKRRILVVDDNRDTAASLATVLTLQGHNTRTAHDGIEGYELASAFRPDVILLDIGLPRMSGYETCRRIREQLWGKSVLIIAISGWGQEEDKRKALEAGFDQHLTKPPDPAVLAGLLSEMPSGNPAARAEHA